MCCAAKFYRMFCRTLQRSTFSYIAVTWYNTTYTEKKKREDAGGKWRSDVWEIVKTISCNIGSFWRRAKELTFYTHVAVTRVQITDSWCLFWHPSASWRHSRSVFIGHRLVFVIWIPFGQWSGIIFRWQSAWRANNANALWDVVWLYSCTI